MVMSAKVILLVEDNADDVALTLRALKKSNVPNEVIVIGDGAEAQDYLYGQGAYEGRDIQMQPSLVLLDLNLPKVNGLDVLKQIRANPVTRCLPVVILSTSMEQKDLISSYELGANSYIRKPVDYKYFVDVIKLLGRYWTELNEVPSVET
jgi:CheY-like chemotaxis protein